VLEYLHNRNIIINVVYFYPETDFLSQEQSLQEKVVRNVIQEYTRSGLFEKLCLVSNNSLDKIAGGAPIIGYFDVLNDVLVDKLADKVAGVKSQVSNGLFGQDYEPDAEQVEVQPELDLEPEEGDEYQADQELIDEPDDSEPVEDEGEETEIEPETDLEIEDEEEENEIT